MSIRSVQTHHVRNHAQAAINRRLRTSAPSAVLEVARDTEQPAAVILHVDSGGNAHASEATLTKAGYACEILPSARGQYGVRIRVRPGQEG